MHAVLEQIYETGQVNDANWTAHNPFPAATPREVALLLNSIVLEHHCAATLEVGMAYGLSTLAICGAHEQRGDGRHIAIDPMQTSLWKGVGLLNAERAGFSHRLTFFEAPSHDVLPQLLLRKEKIDFAFIDGAHLFDYAFVDFYFVDKLIQTGGLIAMDDLWMPAVRRVVSFALTNLDYQLLALPQTAPLLTRTARVLRRYIQDPFGADPAGIKRITSKICLLQKRSDRKRKWDFHRNF